VGAGVGVSGSQAYSRNVGADMDVNSVHVDTSTNENVTEGAHDHADSTPSSQSSTGSNSSSLPSCPPDYQPSIPAWTALKPHAAASAVNSR